MLAYHRHMAATDTQILTEAKDSLLRILQADTTSYSEMERRQHMLAIGDLQRLIDRYEKKVSAASGRRVFLPIERVDV